MNLWSFCVFLRLLVAWPAEAGAAAATVAAYSIGQFVISINGTDVSVRNVEDKIVWETTPQVPFLRIGEAC